MYNVDNGSPVTSGGVETLCANADDMVRVNCLQVQSHLLNPSLQLVSASSTAKTTRLRVQFPGCCVASVSSPFSPFLRTPQQLANTNLGVYAECPSVLLMAILHICMF
jgi:hypothetical protein